MAAKLKAGVGLTVDRAGKFNAFDLLQKDVKRLNSEVQRSGKQLRAMRKNSDSSQLAVSRLTKSVSLAAAGFAAWRIAQRADSLRLLEARISRVTEATGDYNSVNSELNRIAFDNGTALKSTADLFINIQRAAQDLDKTNEESLQLTNTIQQLGVISGASSEAMSNSMRQFSQAMAGGIVRAEEWNSIVENTPEIANRIAKGMGKTVGELRLMVNEGKVLSEDVFNVLLKQSDDIQKDFEKMPLTLDRVGNRLNQNFNRVLGVLNESTGASAGLADVINEIALGLGEVADYLSDGSFEADFSTWSEFADDITDVTDNLTNLLEWFNKLDTRAEETQLTLRDVFLDLPVYAKVAFDNAVADGVYAKDRIVISYETLMLQLEKVWLVIKQTFSARFNDMKVIATKIAQDISYVLADIFTGIGDGAKAIGALEVAERNYEKARQLTFKGTQDYNIAKLEAADAEEAYKKELIAATSAITLQNAEIIKAKNKRQDVIDAGAKLLLATKAEREQQKLLNTEMNKAEAQFAALDEEYRKNTSSATKNTKAVKKNTQAKKDAAKSAKELQASEDARTKSFNTEIATLKRREFAVNANEEALLRYDLAQKTFGKNQLQYTQQQIEEIAARSKNVISLEKEKKKRAESHELQKKQQQDAEKWLKEGVKNNQLLNAQLRGGEVAVMRLTDEYKRLTPEQQKQAEITLKQTRATELLIRQQDQYRDDLKALNQDIQYEIILRTKGTDAARLYRLELEYGSKEKAAHILQQEKYHEQLTTEGELYQSLTQSVTDFITGAISSWSDLRKAITDPIKAQFNLGVNQVLSGGGVGGITNTFKSIGSLLSPSKILGGISSIGSGISSILGGGFSAGISSLGAGLGAVAGPLALLAPVLGSLFGDKEKYRADFGSGTGTKYQADTRTSSAFGTFGLSNIDVNNLKETGQYEGAIAFVESVKVLDDQFASFLPEADIARITKGLEGFSGSALDASLLEDRISIITNNMSEGYKALIDTSLPLEELTANILAVAEAANTNVPTLKALGFNLGKLKTDEIAATLGLTELSGGLENLTSLHSNYYDKAFSEEEKLADQRKASLATVDDLNTQLGLEGSARVESLAGLKLYIESLKTSGDLTTETGRKNLLAAYAAVDAYSYIADAQAALTAQEQERAEKLEYLASIGVKTTSAMSDLATSIDDAYNLIKNNVSSYSDFVFSEEEKLSIARGTAAQSIQALANEYGLSSNSLDTAKELRAAVDKASAEGNLNLVASLLELTPNVKTLAEAGISTTDALAGVPELLRDVVGGVQDVIEPYKAINIQLETTVTDLLPSAVTQVQEIASSLNNIVPIDIHTFNYEQDRKTNEEVLKVLRDTKDAQKTQNDTLVKEIAELKQKQEDLNNQLELERRRSA